MLTSDVFVKTLRLRNFLSYGPNSEETEMKSLNVLIGANGSGKSNLIEALSLLKATPTNLVAPIREGGGAREWIWKGENALPSAEIQATVAGPSGHALRYAFSFATVGQRFELVDEYLEEKEKTNDTEDDVYFYYRYQHGHPAVNARNPKPGPQSVLEPPRYRRQLQREDLLPDQSVLSQRKDPDQYPELTHVGSQFSKMRLYREWNLGRYTAPRLPQKPDMPEDFLVEDGSNLVMILNSLEHQLKVKRRLLKYLRRLYPDIEDVTTRVTEGTVQLFVHESGLTDPIPATRLSDGTLRYLALLSILCHPTPPPVICIEEPELGLHPDAQRCIAELMIEAAERTQLVVTTHSETLVSALTQVPEAIIVCERSENCTILQRLDSSQLAKWLGKYTLGELWRMGEIGGNPPQA
jgi:predicted ATPase